MSSNWIEAMDDKLYTVILQFDPDDKALRQKVIQRLSQFDATTPGRLTNIKHGHLILKKNTPLDSAQRVAHALQKTGALCKILEQPIVKNPPQPQNKVSGTPQDSSRQLINCPRCKHEQPPAIECRTCGVIIEKARRQRKRAPQNKPAKPETPKEKPAQTFSLKDLQRWIGSTFSAWIRKRPVIPEVFHNWRHRVADKMLSCGVVFIVALVIEIGLLYALNMLWYIYTATGVGKYYIAHFPEKAAVIQNLLAMDLLLLGWDSTLMALCVSLLISIIAQLLHLIRYLFDTQGLVGRLAIWCAPAVALAAWGILQQYHLPLYLPAMGLVLLPTICILSSCMEMAHDTIPEIGMIWKTVANAVWKGNNPL